MISMTLNHAYNALYPTPACGVCKKWLTLKNPKNFWNALKLALKNPKIGPKKP